MHFFIVPLRSLHSVKDVGLLSWLVERTLRNLLKQTFEDFHIVVVCNEIPDLPILSDTRISVLQVELPTPANVTERRRDMNLRISAGAEHAFEMAGNSDFTLMKVDADDLLAVNLLRETAALDVEAGFVINCGYFQRLGSRMLWKHFRFNDICGSSISLVMRIKGKAIFTSPGMYADLYFNSYHPKFPALLAAQGCPLTPITSFSAIYTMNYGDNSSGNRLKFKWKPWRMQWMTDSVATRFPGTDQRPTVA